MLVNMFWLVVGGSWVVANIFWLVVGGSGWWRVLVDISWLVMGGGGWWRAVVGRNRWFKKYIQLFGIWPFCQKLI